MAGALTSPPDLPPPRTLGVALGNVAFFTQPCGLPALERWAACPPSSLLLGQRDLWAGELRVLASGRGNKCLQNEWKKRENEFLIAFLPELRALLRRRSTTRM